MEVKGNQALKMRGSSIVYTIKLRLKKSWLGETLNKGLLEGHLHFSMPLSQQKTPKCLVQSQKWQNNLCFQGKPFSITVIQAYAPNSNAEEAEWFYDDLQDLLELTPKKGVLFIIGAWSAKVGSQEILGVTGKFGIGVQNEAGQRLTEFCQENALVIANTLFQHHKRGLYTWTSLDGQYWNQIMFFSAKDGEALYSQWRQDRELTVAQIMSSLLQNSGLNWKK